MSVDRDRKYREYRDEIDDRYRSLADDHRRYNVLLAIGVVCIPFLWVWFWPAFVLGGSAFILGFVGHYVAMMYRYDYERQKERLEADLEHFMEEDVAPVSEEQRHADRVAHDTVRAPRRASIQSPFSRR